MKPQQLRKTKQEVDEKDGTQPTKKQRTRVHRKVDWQNCDYDMNFSAIRNASKTRFETTQMYDVDTAKRFVVETIFPLIPDAAIAVLDDAAKVKDNDGVARNLAVWIRLVREKGTAEGLKFDELPQGPVMSGIRSPYSMPTHTIARALFDVGIYSTLLFEALPEDRRSVIWSEFMRLLLPRSRYPSLKHMPEDRLKLLPKHYEVLYKAKSWSVPPLDDALEACWWIKQVGYWNVGCAYNVWLLSRVPELFWVISTGLGSERGGYDQFAKLYYMREDWRIELLNLKIDMEKDGVLLLQVYPDETFCRDFSAVCRSDAPLYQELWKWKLHRDYLCKLSEDWSEDARVPIVTDWKNPEKTVIGHTRGKMTHDGCYAVRVELLEKLPKKDEAEAWFKKAEYGMLDRLLMSDKAHKNAWDDRAEHIQTLPLLVRVPELHDLIFG